MIDIAILCPIETEFKIIRKILNKSKPAHYQNLSFDFGQIRTATFDWKIAIIEPELNLTLFGIKVKNVIDKLTPKYVFLAGIAGGIKDPQIGDIVIGTKAYLYEGGKETEKGFAARPRIVENKSKDLLTLTKRISREINIDETEFYFGAIASGNKVIATKKSESYKTIKEHYNDTQAVEMESYEFALAMEDSNIPYLNIRGISDLIDGKAKSDAEGHQEKASKKVAVFLQELIYNLPPLQEKENNTATVKTTKKSYFFNNIRSSKKTELFFYDDFVKIKEDDQSIFLRNLKGVEHVKTKGDFSKNWVKIVFEKDGKEEVRFYSDSSILGIGNWFGGSKKLFNKFKELRNRQMDIQF